MNEKDENFMREALRHANSAKDQGELPIGGVLVASDEIIGTGETSVRREGSITAHSELLILKNAGDKVVFGAKRPLTLYTTLEPCLMCLGAAMQCGVDRIVYGMSCAPDGGARFVDEIRASGQYAPEIKRGVLEEECISVFREWPHDSNHPAFGYVQAILAAYGTKSINAV